MNTADSSILWLLNQNSLGSLGTNGKGSTGSAINRALGPDQMASGYRPRSSTSYPGYRPGYRGGGGGMSSRERARMASGITDSVARMTTGITAAILQARQARRAPAGPAGPVDPAPIGGEEYGIQARTPWGTIALGGTAIVAVLGTVLYFTGKQKVAERKAAAA